MTPRHHPGEGATREVPRRAARRAGGRAGRPRTGGLPALALGAALGGLLLGAAAPALAAGHAPEARPAAVRQEAADTVTVTGSGSASAVPDLAVLSVGVEVTRKTAKEAVAAQKTAAQVLLDALHAQGVEDRDIRTESLSLSPVYTPSPQGESKVTGYQAGQTFSVTVRDVDRAGQVVGAVSDAAGDAGRVHGVTFDVSDPSALRARARAAAHRDARDKASQYAELSGRGVGRLVSLTEGESVRPGPGTAPGAAADGGGGVPLAPGEIEERVTVVAVYELL
ncbi:SIMPL domain-containing protein [Streptomyces sp. NPDC101191]|uniref:SIMPL domain-containing protein n=1 Tax=Streptomyces sp. NPDC101191 TaxID=3366126 RepID=UPI0037F87AE8